MKLDLNINELFQEEAVSITAPKMTDAVHQLISFIDNLNHLRQIQGKKEQDIYLINIKEVKSFKALTKKVFALTQHEEYEINLRLYQLEEQLPSEFVRISKSEIININFIYKVKLEANGLIRIFFNNKDFTHSSRRYLKSIKERLAL
ncbi:LytTR family transcriptional regulator [Staphylococcus sp. SQ8-PEA]|uniref:LytTR family transcriptional regulator n=1 Tax=Staphylococcus marylandisciuri TaxID=2981529 RepID=A0ABT2QR76_9STAP|nr:LytTR family DNA-binding domain-containing protein [Staphylococcus marylandisciuri]MCU5746486.1 LytTR family transcriptional regulator [Staphylococcus marylandisciuri]